MSDGGADNGPSNVNESWIIGVASVVFDIDQGQTLEGLYPEDTISEEEGRDVAFNSESHQSLNVHLLCTLWKHRGQLYHVLGL